jgi:GrpB-like predicted nucleotidyltransferase (UPF0157 family)
VRVLQFEKSDVVLLPYDPRLPKVAAAVEQLIAPAANGARMTHFGSTSVPGLEGKNIIDIEMEYAPGQEQGMRDRLAELGFQFAEDAGWPQDGWYLYRGAVKFEGSTFRLHVHVLPRGGEPARKHVHFRNLLRDDPKLGAEYVAVKHRILDSGIREPRAFSAAKSDWMTKVLDEHPLPRAGFAWFVDTLELPLDIDLAGVVEAVRQMPYARAGDGGIEAVVLERHGDDRQKHALLAAVIGERWPDTAPRIVHRVYRRPRKAPAVHRYLVLRVDGREVPVDATLPGDPPWDGTSPMQVACGPGTDYPAGADPDADERALIASLASSQEG